MPRHLATIQKDPNQHLTLTFKGKRQIITLKLASPHCPPDFCPKCGYWKFFKNWDGDWQCFNCFKTIYIS